MRMTILNLTSIKSNFNTIEYAGVCTDCYQSVYFSGQIYKGFHD